MDSTSDDRELVKAVGKAALLLCALRREDPDKNLSHLIDAIDSCEKGFCTAFNALCQDPLYDKLTERSSFVLASSIPLWESFGPQDSLTFVSCLAKQDTPESWSWLNSACFSGPGSVMSTAGFSSPAGWRSLTGVAAALGRDPIVLGMEHSLEEAAESLHAGVKYAALFASRDPFPREQEALFGPDAAVLTVTESSSHIINCARRLLTLGALPSHACESWLGYLPLSVLDSVVKDATKSSVMSSMSLNPDTPLGIMIEAIATL